MIEAVNSTLAQASIAKAPIESGSSQSSFAADANKVREVSEATYFSPTVRVDASTKIAILEFRESSSGDVVIQMPSEQQMRAYQANKVRQDANFEAAVQGNSTTQEAVITEAQVEREVQTLQNLSI